MTMADGDLSAGLVDALGASNDGDPNAATNDPSAGGSEGTQETVDFSGLSPYAQNYIAGLPEADRKEAARHVAHWDKNGFQPYAQRVQAELQQYKQFGDPDTIRANIGIIEQMKADPHGFVQQLIDMGYGPKQAAQAVAQATGQPAVDPYEGLNPAVAQELRELKQWKEQQARETQRITAALGAVSQQNQTVQQQREAAEADREVQQMLDQAKAKHGNFDELWVMQRMAQGLSADAAALAFKEMVSGYNRPAPRAPGVMSASSMPAPAPDKLTTPEDRENALAQALRSMNSG